MRIHIFACRVLTRELSYFAANSPHIVDITWLPQGLHDIPDSLRTMLKQQIRQLHEDIASGIVKHKPDVIALGYGLCCNGVVGLESGDLPLIVPKTDDCIALFVGSQKRYLELFERHNGTYWLNNGWIETCHGSTDERRAMHQKKWQEYADTYDEDNADFLMEQEALWRKNYNMCGFIASGVHKDEQHVCIAKQMAEDYEWRFERIEGDERMLRLLANGEWNEEEFLICPPHSHIEAAYDGSKIRYVMDEE